MQLVIPSRSVDEPGVPPEWLEVQRASKIFDDMCNEIIDEVRRLTRKPIPGSVREQDANVDLKVADLLAQCAQDRLLFTLDNALGASKCVKHPTLSHAAYACARATVETASTLFWLFDEAENPGTEARFARVLELYCQHAWSKRTWDMSVLEILGKNENDVKHSFEQRIESVTNIAEDLGMPYKRTDQGRRPVFAKWQDATIRARRCIEDGDLDYRSYSRIMHCETFAVAVSWMVQPNVSGPGGPIYADQLALRMIRNLATWIARVTQTLYSYWGIDLDRLDRCLLVYFTRLGIPESGWTWRKRDDAEA